MIQMTTKKIFNLQILILIFLAILLGGFWGYQETVSTLRQNAEHNTAYLSAIVDGYRSDILNGEFGDMNAAVQGSAKNLGTTEIKVKNVKTNLVTIIQSPFVKEKDLSRQNEICGEVENGISFFRIIKGCQKQNFAVFFDEAGKYPYLEISWNIISDVVPSLLQRMLKTIIFFLTIAMFIAYFFNRFMQDEVKRTSALEAMSQVATQVAHDIRSPLAALNVAALELSELPEDKRILIRSAVQRIDDIANDLSAKKFTEDLHQTKEQKERQSVQLLSGLVESLVSEKRVQFRSRLNIKIESEIDKTSYGLFAKIQGVEFKRVLSNLVNNAVEAMCDSGTVILSLRAQRSNLDCHGPEGPRNDNACIIVSDNGKGIPPETLPQLMQKGATFGKEAGSGLGLFHAKETVQRWHGDVRLESQVGQGTKVILEIPLEPAPDWFVSEINLGAETQIVILDDDQSIHQIWQNRFDDVGIKRDQVFHFTTAEQLTKWYEEMTLPEEAYLFLCDYELLGDEKTGLQVIEELGIADRAILVTSHFEDEPVRKNCERLKIKLLPKNLSGFVPIDLLLCVAENRVVVPEQNLDAILIDDDSLIRSTWQAVARIKGRKLVVCATVDEFFRNCGEYNRQVPVYIDSNLGDDIKGEVMAQEISKIGFENIYLATGYRAEDFDEMPWIKGIVDKTPPFMD